jgi:hypothetical protein
MEIWAVSFFRCSKGNLTSSRREWLTTNYRIDTQMHAIPRIWCRDIFRTFQFKLYLSIFELNNRTSMPLRATSKTPHSDYTIDIATNKPQVPWSSDDLLDMYMRKPHYASSSLSLPSPPFRRCYHTRTKAVALCIELATSEDLYIAKRGIESRGKTWSRTKCWIVKRRRCNRTI